MLTVIDTPLVVVADRTDQLSICALALLFMRFDPHGRAGTGVNVRGGITLWQLTYANDNALAAKAS